MTFEAGTILDITETCDKVLEHFYFRKGSTIDLDRAQIELPFGYERYDIAIKKLEKDGYLKITRTKTIDFGQITSDGEVFYRTTSYQRLAQAKRAAEKRTSRKENLEIAKNILETVFGFITVALTIWTFTLDKKIEKYEDKINRLQNALDSISTKHKFKTDTLVNELTKSHSIYLK